MNRSGLVDPFGRRIDYLRLSVTDQCNLRCVYCMPASGVGFHPRHALMTDPEIVALAACFAGLGIKRIRITGGEPLIRPGIVELVRALAEVDGVEDLSLSTNGMRLEALAEPLARAGLDRVNVSLDTLCPERFQAITRGGTLGDVRRGIEASLAAGLSPVKLNVVVMRGMNDDEIPAFVQLAHERSLHVRFIELMPIGDTGFFTKDHWLPFGEILARALSASGGLEPLPSEEAPTGFGPATYYRAPGAAGTLGFIAALGCNFCARCNRLRLTAAGQLMPCLACPVSVDLRSPLRRGVPRQEIEALIQACVSIKPKRHSMDPDGGSVREAFMCSLGG